MNKIKKIVHILGLTLIVMTLTLFGTTLVQTVEGERNIRFGYPAQFVSMQSSYDWVGMNGSFNYQLSNPHEHPMFVLWDGFRKSFAVWLALVASLFVLSERFIKNHYHIFEMTLTAFLFLLVPIAFFKFPFEIVILLLFAALLTYFLNKYCVR